MSGITASQRFPSVRNNTLRKLCTNLVLFPRLHFPVVGIAPITSTATQAYQHYSAPELVAHAFDAKNLVCIV
jgi:tubulin beta